MKKNYVIISIVLVIAVIGIYSGCNGTDKDAETEQDTKPGQDDQENVLVVQSSDGKASVEIPESALPESVNLRDISVSRLDDSNLPVLGADNDHNITYGLEPDGLVFDEPVLLRATFAIPDQVMPLVFHVTRDNQVEVLDDTEITIDAETNVATLAARVSHFSQITINVAFRFFDYEVEAADIIVGQNTNARATIRRSHSLEFGYEVTGGPDVAVKAIPGTGQISADLRPGFFLTPDQTFRNQPPLTALVGDTFTIPNNKYVCTKKSRTSVSWEVTFVVQMEKIVYESEEEETDIREREITDTSIVTKTNKLNLHASFDCEDDTTPTPTPTPTPSQTAGEQGDSSSAADPSAPDIAVPQFPTTRPRPTSTAVIGPVDIDGAALKPGGYTIEVKMKLSNCLERPERFHDYTVILRVQVFIPTTQDSQPTVLAAQAQSMMSQWSKYH